MTYSEEFQQYFWDRVNKNGPLWADPKTGEASHCWEWAASRTKWGYGQIRHHNKMQRAHRVAWEIAYGEELGEFNALHKCDNRACCNPNHLFKGTHADNVKDRDTKKRQAHGDKITENRNTARGERHGNAIFTEAEIEQIREMGRQGVIQRVRAALFGTSQTNISKIDRRVGWK